MGARSNDFRYIKQVHIIIFSWIDEDTIDKNLSDSEAHQ